MTKVGQNDRFGPRFHMLSLLPQGWRSYMIVRSVVRFLILSVSRITRKRTSTKHARHGQGMTLISDYFLVLIQKTCGCRSSFWLSLTLACTNFFYNILPLTRGRRCSGVIRYDNHYDIYSVTAGRQYNGVGGVCALSALSSTVIIIIHTREIKGNSIMQYVLLTRP